MIQRVQTVYLMLVLIFALLFIFLPMGYLSTPGTTLSINGWNLPETILEATSYATALLGWLSLVLAIIIMILTLHMILQFRKRLYQIKIGKILILIHLITVVSTFFYLDNVKVIAQGTFSYGIAIIFPLISMLLVLMANRAIRRDENLVRSADRLR
jgi:hypothetical protein